MKGPEPMSADPAGARPMTAALPEPRAEADAETYAEHVARTPHMDEDRTRAHRERRMTEARRTLGDVADRIDADAATPVDADRLRRAAQDLTEDHG